MTHFFISYNSADRPWAEWIAWQLEDAGYTTVLQAWDFRPGSNFIVAMQQAASEAERIIAVLSPDYLTARFTQPEWAAAFAQDPTGEKGSLLPVRVRDCTPQGLLPQIIYIDLVGLAEAETKAALLAGVRRERAKPTTPPGFPGGVHRVAPRFPGVWGGQLTLEGALQQLAALPLDTIPALAPLPPGSRMPLSPNPLFVGRAADLQALAAALKVGGTVASTGLGGLGKTQLASEFVHGYGQFFAGGVFWLSAATVTGMPAEVAACGGPGTLELRVDFSALPLDDQVRLVQAAWQTPLPRLLVFDNCEDEAVLAQWRPPSGGCRVLVTSRRAQWDAALGVHV